MKYLKCRLNYGQFVDPQTRFKIGRGEIVPVKNPTETMKRMLLKRGLIEVSESEYLAWKDSKEPKDDIMTIEQIAPVQPVIEYPVQEKIEEQVEVEEVLEEKIEDPKSKKLAERFKNKNKPSKE